MIERSQTDRLFAALKPHVAAGYRTWPNILHESAIRAVAVRLANSTDRERLIRQEEDDGFRLVRPLAARLAEHEAGTQTLAEFVPRLLDALNDEALLRSELILGPNH